MKIHTCSMSKPVINSATYIHILYKHIPNNYQSLNYKITSEASSNQQCFALRAVAWVCSSGILYHSDRSPYSISGCASNICAGSRFHLGDDFCVIVQELWPFVKIFARFASQNKMQDGMGWFSVMVRTEMPWNLMNLSRGFYGKQITSWELLYEYELVPFLVLFIDSLDLVVRHRFTFLLRENCWAHPRPGSPGLPACPFAPTFPVFPIFPRCPGVPWRPAGPTTEAPAGPAGPWGPAGPSGPWGPTAPPGPYMPVTIKAGRPAGPANKVTFCCGTTDAWQLQRLGKHLQTKWRNYIQTVRKG